MESEYKNSRISLQFNLLDPDQAEAFGLLKSMGHKKSLIISKALLYYINNNPDALKPFPQSSSLNKLIFKSWIKDIINELEIPVSNLNTSLIEKNTPTSLPSPQTESQNPVSTPNQSPIQNSKQSNDIPIVDKKDPLVISQPVDSKTPSISLENIANCDDEDLENFLSGLDMFQ